MNANIVLGANCALCTAQNPMHTGTFGRACFHYMHIFTRSPRARASANARARIAKRFSTRAGAPAYAHKYIWISFTHTVVIERFVESPLGDL